MSIDTSIFDMNLDNLVAPEKAVYESNIFKPSLKKENVKTYEAIIKFIPWHADYTKSRISKWSIWLANPNTDVMKMVDCPSTVGDKSILRDLYFELKKSNRVEEQELAQQFSRKERNFALIQIVEDKQHPDNEGKIKVIEFGKTIREKIDAQLKPMGTRVTPHNPFDIFEGKLFHFFIKMEGGFQNYDNSGFLDEKSSILIDGQPVKKAKENFEKVLTFLSENSPNLMAHEYQAWDEETKDFVLDTIQAILPPGRLLSTIMKKSGIKTMEDVEVVTERTKTTTRSSSIPQINISEEIDDTEVEEEDDELSEIDEFLSKTKSNNKPSKAKASFFEED